MAFNKRGINAAFRFYGMPEPHKLRAYRPRAANDDLEKHVLTAVGELLAAHPKVLFAVRQNGGALTYSKDGRQVPVWFYKIVTRQPVRISDYWGILRDGRLFAIECKRPSWRMGTEKRELEQAAFLMLVRNCGGVAGFVTDARRADEILKG